MERQDNGSNILNEFADAHVRKREEIMWNAAEIMKRISIFSVGYVLGLSNPTSRLTESLQGDLRQK